MSTLHNKRVCVLLCLLCWLLFTVSMVANATHTPYNVQIKNKYFFVILSISDFIFYLKFNCTKFSIKLKKNSIDRFFSLRFFHILYMELDEWKKQRRNIFLKRTKCLQYTIFFHSFHFKIRFSNAYIYLLYLCICIWTEWLIFYPSNNIMVISLFVFFFLTRFLLSNRLQQRKKIKNGIFSV